MSFYDLRNYDYFKYLDYTYKEIFKLKENENVFDVLYRWLKTT